jgi:hypothetical protein
VLSGETMGKHLTPVELDRAFKLKAQSKMPNAILKDLSKKREKRGEQPPDITTLRRALKGKTHRRGRQETRGAKKVLTASHLRALDSTRKKLIAKAGNEYEVHWDDVIKKAKVPQVDATTAAKNMQAAGYDVAARKPREKPLRTDDDEALREKICKKWSRYSDDYFNDELDGIWDNKWWPFETHDRAKKHKKATRVRFHLRKRSEGLQKGFTIPSKHKHKMNPGAGVKLLAAIVKGKIRVWHYLPKNAWNAKVAADCYRGPIIKALRRAHGPKKTFKILEDNDPQGYKTKSAAQAKKELGIHPIAFPKYSPDLNPMDYFVWDEVERRLEANAPKKKESLTAFKERLRRTAMGIPASVIRKGVASMKKRAQQVVKAGGGDIPRD